jgi:prolyl-tRNA editing enzyme YbaK/EbsC (Cys-tRNA(Pro) deacylase)
MLNESLTKNPTTIQNILNQLNLSCRVIELTNTTRTAADAASSIGCQIAQIVKSLIFKTQANARPILVLTSGINRVCERQIACYVDEPIVKADARFVKEITGFTIGGVPPIGHKHHIDLIYIDQTLMTFSELWAAAGTTNAVFCISSTDLKTITHGKVIFLSSMSS